MLQKKKVLMATWDDPNDDEEVSNLALMVTAKASGTDSDSDSEE
ncbi:hypothetical protein A2U01_0043765, partial [Trifolium medium]|nr:hypothetical protein [Trifolium medium]